MSSDKKTKIVIRLLSFWLKVILFWRVSLEDYSGTFYFDAIFLLDIPGNLSIKNCGF